MGLGRWFMPQERVIEGARLDLLRERLVPPRNAVGPNDRSGMFPVLGRRCGKPIKMHERLP
jgi:hypothetical protein